MRIFIKKFLNYIANKNNKTYKDLNELISFYINSITKNYQNLSEKDIKQILFLLEDLKGTSLVEALKIIESLNHTQHIVGDICEFGVAQGKTSKLMAHFIKNSDKKIYLYDSFEGLPKASEKDVLKDDIFNLGKIENYEGKMSHPVTKVMNELKSIKFDLKRVVINKGFFNKQNLNNFKLPNSVSFAYIDFDYYQPTLDVLHILEDKLVVGSKIIVDDYDFFSTGAKTAVDEWFEKNKQNFQINLIKTIQASFAVIKKIK